MPNQQASQQRLPFFLIYIVLVALVLRVVVMVFLLPEQLEPERYHWHMGYEAGKIAYSIVQGHGFRKPTLWRHGPNGMDDSSLSVSGRGGFQAVRHLYKGLGDRLAFAECSDVGADVRSRLPDRSHQFWRAGCQMVGMGMGILSLTAFIFRWSAFGKRGWRRFCFACFSYLR